MCEVITGIIIFLLIIIGSSLFRSGIKTYTKKNSPFIIINAKNPDTIEQTIRRSIRKYPEHTIYVFNRSENPEMKKILKILQNEFYGVHILTGNVHNKEAD